MRDLDDKVIYALNNSLPTASIKARTESNPEASCKGLFDSLKTSYIQREKLIQDCILQTAEQVSQLKKQRDDSDDPQVEKRFKSEQRKVINCALSLKVTRKVFSLNLSSGQMTPSETAH